MPFEFVELCEFEFDVALGWDICVEELVEPMDLDEPIDEPIEAEPLAPALPPPLPAKAGANINAPASTALAPKSPARVLEVARIYLLL